MRKIRIIISVAVFLMLTIVKFISPSYAVQMKDEIQPILDRDDDLHLFLHRINRVLHPIDYHTVEPFIPNLPLTHLRQTLEGLTEDPLANLPKASLLPEPAPIPESDPGLAFGYAARETFLNAQAQITGAAPPENVSYDVLSLPFEECTPISGETSSGFGYRLHPIQNEIRFHYGTDFAAATGTVIHAFADGTVLEAGTDGGYGNYVKLDHGNGFVTLYGHCNELLVAAGEEISRGQVIALVGSTGQSTGPHLHFELIHNGIYLNPEFYLYS